MIPLAVLFAIVLCVAMLVGLCLLAWFLSELALFIFPRLASSALAQPIIVQFKQETPKQRRRPDEVLAARIAPERELPSVVICRDPLGRCVYFVGITKRRVIWSWRKSNAKEIPYNEAILKSWIAHLEQRGERNLFVVWAERKVAQ